MHIMKSVRISQVPQYLRGGSFYQSLDLSNEDDVIEVPKNVMKLNSKISNCSQLYDYLRSLRFWGVADIGEDCIQFILRRHPYSPTGLSEFEGAFPTLTVLTELLRIPDKSVRFQTAVAQNAYEVLNCMITLHYLIPEDACYQAVHLSSSRVLELLHSHGATLSLESLKQALWVGNIDAVNYLDAHGFGLTGNIDKVGVVNYRGTGYSVIVGNLPCHVYAMAHGCVYGVCTAESFASADNHLDMLQYAHEHGCPWDKYTTLAAARNGALQCLKYAYEHGCPTTARAYTAARENGQHACAAYLREKGIFF